MDQFPMTMTLSRHSGEQRQFLFRRCDQADLSEFMALQKKISDAVHDPEIYSSVEEEEIREALREDFCVGTYLDGVLVAFTIMITNRVSPRNYGTYVGYSPEQQLKCVSMEITIVEEPCRGFGMQKLFVRFRENAARQLGATQAMVTIGPENTYSLNNLLSSGYEIIDTRPMYEGAMRHILRKEL